jgi:hypothetical protein
MPETVTLEITLDLAPEIEVRLESVDLTEAE